MLSLMAGILVVSGILIALILHQGLEGRVLIAGVSPDFKPLEYWDNGSLRGISIDLLEYAARRSGYTEVRFKAMPYSQLLKAVNNGSVDVAVGIVFSDETVGKALLTKPYYNLSIRIIRLSEKHAPQSIWDLGGLRVGVLKGDDFSLGLLYSLQHRYGLNLTIVPLNPYSVNMFSNHSKQGGIDVMVFTHGFPEPQCNSSCVETTISYSFAVRRGETGLLAKLNDSINQALSTGFMEKIIEKYGYG